MHATQTSARTLATSSTSDTANSSSNRLNTLIRYTRRRQRTHEQQPIITCDECNTVYSTPINPRCRIPLQHDTKTTRLMSGAGRSPWLFVLMDGRLTLYYRRRKTNGLRQCATRYSGRVSCICDRRMNVLDLPGRNVRQRPKLGISSYRAFETAECRLSLLLQRGSDVQ